MKIFGLEIIRANRRDLSPVYGPNLWTNVFSSIHEPFTGAWQRNAPPVDRTSLLASSAVYSCVTGISSDIAKLRIKLCRDVKGIWEEITENSPWLSLLRRPNHYQTQQQFSELWILSKLLHGNAYILKDRDQRGIVNAMYVLDPCRVTALVADNGDIYYDIKQDYLSRVEDQLIAPASEVIHDRMPALFHPLIGTSPLYACALSADMMNSMQNNSTSFFRNRSLPGGMLTAPGRIDDATAKRLKETFEARFSGTGLGRLFVGGDGLDFKPFMMTAEQSDLVEQLKWSVSDVARAFHYPEFKLGGPLPPYSGNMQALTLSYYTDCLQSLIEAMESCLDDGLELPSGQGTELDVDNLLRMDSKGLAEVTAALVGGGIEAPNEGRYKHNLPPVKGGESPYLQQQNYSLEALAKRDAQEDPFAKGQQQPSQQQPVLPARGLDLEAAELAAREVFAT